MNNSPRIEGSREYFHKLNNIVIEISTVFPLKHYFFCFLDIPFKRMNPVNPTLTNGECSNIPHHILKQYFTLL